MEFMFLAGFRATVVLSTVAWALSAAPALAGFMSVDFVDGVEFVPWTVASPALESGSMAVVETADPALPEQPVDAPLQPLFLQTWYSLDAGLPGPGSTGGMNGSAPTGGGSAPSAYWAETPPLTPDAACSCVERQPELRLPIPFLDGIFRPPQG
jgi:hypothetical protein